MMENLYTWTATVSYPDITGLSALSETRPFSQAREQLLAYLHMMSDRYPHSRPDIMRAHSDVRGLLESNFSAGARRGWSRQFTVIDIEPHAVISLSLTLGKAGSRHQQLTRADAEGKMKGVSDMPEPPKPPDPNRKRAGNAERTRYAEHITTQYAIGMLEPAEFDERLDAVNAARYADELPPLIAGLDPLPPKAYTPELPSKSEVKPPAGRFSLSHITPPMALCITTTAAALLAVGIGASMGSVTATNQIPLAIAALLMLASLILMAAAVRWKKKE